MKMPLLDVPAGAHFRRRTQHSSKRIVFAEGHELRVLRAVESIVENKSAIPIVIGRESDIKKRIADAKIGLKAGEHVEIVEPSDEFEFCDQWLAFQSAKLLKWNVSNLPAFIRNSRNTAHAARLVNASWADGMICGTSGEFAWHFVQLKAIFASMQRQAAGSLHVLFDADRLLCLSDILIDVDAGSTEIAEIAVAAAQHVCALGAAPRIALCQDGCGGDPRDEMLRAAVESVKATAPELDIQGPVALSDAIGSADGAKAGKGTGARYNTLVFCRTGVATMVRDVLRSNANWRDVGPFLLGTANRAHIVTPETAPGMLTKIAAFTGTRLDRLDAAWPAGEEGCRNTLKSDWSR